jgi:glycosyltransferase involved in cell wall biosynthesis
MSDEENVRIIRLEHNLRQGGARNRGVSAAKGEYIVFLDQDDYLHADALSQAKAQLNQDKNLDVLFIDSFLYQNGKLCSSNGYASNDQSVMTGEAFICANKIPWCPWCYIYKRQFLLDNNLKFTECVRWEDADFVMQVTLSAQRMAYRPIYGVVYCVNEESTSLIGQDIDRIRDFANMAWRVRKVAETFQSRCPKGATVVLAHHYYMYKTSLRRLFWRLSVHDLLDIFTLYPAEEHTPDYLTRFSLKHPRILAYSFAVIRPLLTLAWGVKQRFRG